MSPGFKYSVSIINFLFSVELETFFALSKDIAVPIVTVFGSFVTVIFANVGVNVIFVPLGRSSGRPFLSFGNWKAQGTYWTTWS